MSLFNKLIVSSLPFIPKPVVGIVASRYVAGNNLQDALHAIRNLNSHGFVATIDLLGEDVHDRSIAVTAREVYKEILRSVEREGLE